MEPGGRHAWLPALEVFGDPCTSLPVAGGCEGSMLPASRYRWETGHTCEGPGDGDTGCVCTSGEVPAPLQDPRAAPTAGPLYVGTTDSNILRGQSGRRCSGQAF